MLNDNQLQKTPALALPLTGRHLIEASAGTGKTWTLTGIVLRLIVEAGYPCEKIIATTFTKSASADMKQRIRERLSSFYQLLNLVMSGDFYNSLSNIDAKTNNHQEQQDKLADFFQAIEKIAIQQGKKTHYEDLVNQYLLMVIIKQMFGIDKVEKALDFHIAKQRTQIALNQLDKLFVSTIDSLCQKWLREFSSETGFSADIKIANNYMDYVEQMIHDQFRGFLSHLYREFGRTPVLYEFLQKKLGKPNDYIAIAERALNFYSTQIDCIELTSLSVDMVKLERLGKNIVEFSDENFKQYFDENYRQSVKMKANTLHKHFVKIKDIQQKLATKAVSKWLLEEATEDELKLLEAILECVKKGDGFKKGGEAEREVFIAFGIVQDLYTLACWRNEIVSYAENLRAYFVQFIANYVRINLPKWLEVRGLTTFSLLLARLNQALLTEQGEMLVKHIRHEYPVALIDESQDINTEQALLLQRLYLHDSSGRVNTQQGFLLLVGDPKQAIYGFRGGDVYNYATLRNLFPEKPRQLTDNFRSSKHLIDSLNQWYGVNGEALDNENHYLPNLLGEQIFYHQIEANREQAYLFDSHASTQQSATLYQLKADYKQNFLSAMSAEESDEDVTYVDFDDIVVSQICLWFDKNTKEKLVFRQTLENGELLERDLTLSDICILSAKNHQLDQIEKKLNQRGVATLRGGSRSVFADTMSHDILKLMVVLLQPYHQGKLRSLLMSCFFQMELDNLNKLFAEGQTVAQRKWLDNLQRILVKAGEKWQKESFLVAVQWLFQQTLDEYKTNIWQNLAKHENGERWLIDLRQLLDIISEQIYHQADEVGEYQLFDWFAEQVANQPKEDKFLQHRLSTETGVQLMSIHRSKGLEFAVVFVVGLTDSLNRINEPYLYLYTKPDANPENALNSRRLSAIACVQDKDFKSLEMQNLYEEKLRLLYVAFTRAKERVYFVTVGQYQSQSTSPLKPFVKMVENKSNAKNKQPDIKNFCLQERLTKVMVIDTAKENSLSKYMAFLQENPSHQLQIQEDKKAEDTTIYIKNYLENIHKIQYQKFVATSHTSFTALLHYTQDEHFSEQIDEQDFDNMIDINNHLPVMQALPLRFRFEKGTVSGKFLHKILEEFGNYQERQTLRVPFDNANPPPKRWSVMIDKSLRRQNMPDKYYSTQSAITYQKSEILTDKTLQSEHLALSNWLYEILHTPLHAPLQRQVQTVRLIDIHPNQKQAEMGFSLYLNQGFSLVELNNLFADYGIELNLQQIDNTNFWQYLKGEIDLVYEYQGCYYIIDYKNNFLGESFADYQQDVLKSAMDKHHYWLQASIYQVALHRFLKLRLHNYDVGKHLGAVEYLFIRGVSPDCIGCGSLVWQIPVELVLALDKLLGAENV